MKKICFKISGGAKVRFSRSKHKTVRMTGLLLMFLLMYSSTAFAQGSIYGDVTNSDLSIPANGEISFYGFLDNTDEEIRIETSIGAGYDAGKWFDDFQNYLTEAPGNPYDYYFFNTANGENTILSALIPNNSFQQENITLAAGTFPPQPVGLEGRSISSSSAVISWIYNAGETYHVYRRLATSSGSFFRIDDPTGNLASPGVAAGYFVDNAVNGTSTYEYLVIAQDGSGNLSQHSNILVLNSASIEAPVVNSIVPASGSYVGGTLVTINGLGFDMNGTTATIGGASLTSVVVLSPNELSGLTPAGTIGLADVAVSNNASLLSSAPLVGGYEYLGNSAPVLAAIGPQTGIENVLLSFAVSATDPDATIPTLTTSVPLPGTATFTDHGDGTGTFEWTPNFIDAGLYQITFFAGDGIDQVSEIVDITINDAGNQAPVLNPIGAQAVLEGGNLNFAVTASDPDGTIPTLSASDIPTNATFVDNLDGTGTFDFNPDLTQSGIFEVIFKAFDGTDVDSEVVAITVAENNQIPVLAAIGAQNGSEGINLNFVISSSDADGTIPTLSTSTPLPGTATFTDNLDGTGTFNWTPSFTEAGLYQVTFYAADAFDIVSEIVDITIGEAGNQVPVLDPIGPQTIAEGANLNFIITASDADGTIPTLSTSTPLPGTATFIDNGDGTGTFDWTPAFADAGLYQVTFYAADLTDNVLEVVDITVTEAGNQAPILAPIVDAVMNEGESIDIPISATDPDGGFAVLSALSTLSGFTFVDNGDGTGLFSYAANYMQSGTDSIWFIASDQTNPLLYTRMGIELTINDINIAPAIDSIGPFGVKVDDLLTFTVTATDSTDPVTTNVITLSAIGMPNNAGFTNNGDNTGTFTFTPDDAQVGSYTVTFMATDAGTPPLSSTFAVNINVVLDNRVPILTVEGAVLLAEGDSVFIPVSATDADGTIPTLTATRLPENATMTDFGDGTGELVFRPSYIQAGLYGVEVRASDGIAVVKKNVLIQVTEAGNQAPIVDPVPDQTVTEGETLTFNVLASDPDATIPSLRAESLPLFASFTDNGDGTGTIEFSPVFVQAGTYEIYIIADDGEYTDTITVVIVVEEAGNQPPTINPVDDQIVLELNPLTFYVTSSDPDSTASILTAENLPSGATFTDALNGAGTFYWVPTYLQNGEYTVTFIATDPNEPYFADTVYVLVTVNNFNIPPVIQYVGLSETETRFDIFEGDTVSVLLYAFDLDGTIPSIEINTDLVNIAENMTVFDSGNGYAVFTFVPDYTQGNSQSGDPVYYTVRFRAVDAEDDILYGILETSLRIYVSDINFPPVLTRNPVTTSYTIPEGNNVTITVSATDDKTITSLTALNLPANATFTGLTNIKTFSFTPSYMQSGIYTVTFIASDGTLADTAIVDFTVTETGNHAPNFVQNLSFTTLVVANRDTVIVAHATDPDGDPVTITCDSVGLNAVFTDSGIVVATYYFAPVTSQVNEAYRSNFIVTDPSGLADTTYTIFRVISILRGDVNSDTELNILDIMYLVNFLYKEGQAPASMDASDANYDTAINILDCTYLINFFYKSGPPPPSE
ncbi:MAG: Ig-like domain-containing protein [Candidatus Zixiibacteriota bacterium]